MAVKSKPSKYKNHNDGHYVRLGEFEIRFNAPSVNVRKRGDIYSA
jgi:hypothetical protein